MKLLRHRKSRPSDEALAAHERAKDALARAHEQAPKVRALGDRLREIQEHNHLAEAFEHALRGRT